VLDYLPIAATGFAIPQFLPQIVKLRRIGDAEGVSWPWAALTGLNNAAWFGYFALSEYWTALVPSGSVTLLAGTVAVMLATRGRATSRAAALVGAWFALLAGVFLSFGRAGLGTLLTAAFIVAGVPSMWTAYRTARPTGLSLGTWMLILGELTCWSGFGLYRADPRLIALGFTGVSASLLMLFRITRVTSEAPRVASST
jgi:hypothetical protein